MRITEVEESAASIHCTNSFLVISTQHRNLLAFPSTKRLYFNNGSPVSSTLHKIQHQLNLHKAQPTHVQQETTPITTPPPIPLLPQTSPHSPPAAATPPTPSILLAKPPNTLNPRDASNRRRDPLEPSAPHTQHRPQDSLQRDCMREQDQRRRVARVHEGLELQVRPARGQRVQRCEGCRG